LSSKTKSYAHRPELPAVERGSFTLDQEVDMRRDMARVIIERPRDGGAPARAPRTRVDFEDVSERAPMKPRPMDRKSQTDLWGPLRRFLRANVGRPWNTVWSEICEQADHRSVAGMHLRGHVHDLVETRPMMRGKTAYSSTGRQLGRGFYVDPRTGLLCRRRGR
jgi:hypothetical protein